MSIMCRIHKTRYFWFLEVFLYFFTHEVGRVPMFLSGATVHGTGFLNWDSFCYRKVDLEVILNEN